MEKNQMKNIVILKNLPSNLVEEAIVIFKTNKYAKKFEYIDKNEAGKKENISKNSKDYIIREAESVLSNYINAVEKNEKKKNVKNEHTANISLKIYAIAVTIALVTSFIIKL